MNYYEILDVSRVATYEEIKAKHTMKMDRKKKIAMRLIVECGCVRNMIRMENLKGKCRKVGNR